MESISYSQISMYMTCPYKWKLKYIDKVGTFEDNIHLLFGTAMHIVIQYYLTEMYNTTISKADSIDLNKKLFDEMKRLFVESKNKTNIFPCTKEELKDAYTDGTKILEWFKKHKSDYFLKKEWELLGCEIPLQKKLQKNVNFIAYIDIVLKNKNTNRIYIKDFKTSNRGWNSYQKSDEIKIQQMVLYKKFYSDIYNISIDDIDIEYIILKRKLDENPLYVQKRIQKFSPASGSITIKKTLKNLDIFIENTFDDNGNYNMNVIHKKNPSQWNCRFCEFGNNGICNKIVTL